MIKKNIIIYDYIYSPFKNLIKNKLKKNNIHKLLESVAFFLLDFLARNKQSLKASGVRIYCLRCLFPVLFTCCGISRSR